MKNDIFVNQEFVEEVLKTHPLFNKSEPIYKSGVDLPDVISWKGYRFFIVKENK